MIFAIGIPMVLIAAAAASSSPSISSHTVLTLDLRGGLSDQPGSSFLGLGGSNRSVMSIVQALHAAENDPRVRGLYVRLPEGGMTPATADELRRAFQRFRTAGKTIVMHSQGFYAGGAVISTYELAATASELWMQDGSQFQVTGLATEETFYRRLFDRFGVQPDFQQREQYKNAINSYTESDFTPAHREGQLSWMTSIYESAIAAAAADRRRNPAELRRVLEAGPYSAEQAKDLRLIDRVGQEHEAQQSILATASASTENLLDIGDYTPPAPRGPSGGVIAVINAEGAITTGSGGSPNLLSGRSNVSSDQVAAAFYRAIGDADVRAIVFRVSSPGGSDTASEQILSAVRAAVASNRPVVVSMGGYAASGGYWISSQASQIVAEPTTLTGSIGVYGGRLALGQALGRWGVDVRPIGVGGQFAGSGGMAAPMTDAQRAAYSAEIDRVYQLFIGRVAAGRRLTYEQAHAMARGRVWTGAQALQLRLVDRLGGFYEAVDQARQLAHLNGEPRLRVYGPRRSPFGFLGRLFGAQSQDAQTLARLNALSEDPQVRAMLQQLADARARASGQGTVLASIPDLGE
jgi:protease-4